MIENITNKTKFLVFLVAIPLFIFLAYKKSWSNVYNSYNTLRTIKKQDALAVNQKKELATIKSELNLLDHIIGKEVLDPDIVQQEIFDIYSRISSNSSLEKFYEPHRFKNQYYSISTNSILLSGTFKNVIDAAYFFEKEFQYSRVVSMSFFTKKNYRTKAKKLYTKLVFQNYEKRN